MKNVTPLFWPAFLEGKILKVLDETLIPGQLKYIEIKNVEQAVRVIRNMKTRAFGQVLVVLYTFSLEILRNRKLNSRELVHRVKQIAQALNQSRPTFPFAEVTGGVVHWAQAELQQGQDVRTVLLRHIDGYLKGIYSRRIKRVEQIAANIKNGDSILTHCNVSGELAMAAAICRKQKKAVQFYCTETRPYFQGTKLTYWELNKANANVTLVADNAIGTLMADHFINKVIVGSDRNCANGDFANKIGTYQIAVLAKEFKIPLLVLTQPSKKIASGRDIPVEIRPEKELLEFGGRRLLRGNVRGLYPGFDVVGHEYVTKEIALNVN